MNHRDRVLQALAFQPVDKIPLQIHPSPAGLFEHGKKLLDLMQQCGHDFDDISKLSLPVVSQDHFDTDGRYDRIETDAWGTTWEYRLYGVWGHRVAYPVANLANVNSYHPPGVKRLRGDDLIKAQVDAIIHRERYYLTGGGVSLFETMQNLCSFEDVLIGIAQDSLEINRLADLLVEYYQVVIDNALAIGVDAVSVGDDFGTQQAMMISPKVWRRFFMRRYKALLDPVKAAGKQVFFHSCGKIDPILEDLREVGADAIWPQMALFDQGALARRCRELGMAVQLHPDRGDLMQRAAPDAVRDYLLRLVDTFDCLSGGSWLYLEVDPGFAWPNVQMMFETVMEMRDSTC